MRNNVIFKNGRNKPKASDKALKDASLLYFKEALFKERYEDCALQVQRARQFL